MEQPGNYYYERCVQKNPVRNKEVLEICDNAWTLLLQPDNQSTVDYFNNNGPLLEATDLKLGLICSLGGETIRLTLVRSEGQPDYLTLEFLESKPVLTYSFFPKNRMYSYTPNRFGYDYLTNGRKIEDINLKLASLAIESNHSNFR
jgi:hypothetical protein